MLKTVDIEAICSLLPVEFEVTGGATTEDYLRLYELLGLGHAKISKKDRKALEDEIFVAFNAHQCRMLIEAHEAIKHRSAWVKPLMDELCTVHNCAEPDIMHPKGRPCIDEELTCISFQKFFVSIATSDMTALRNRIEEKGKRRNVFFAWIEKLFSAVCKLLAMFVRIVGALFRFNSFKMEKNAKQLYNAFGTGTQNRMRALIKRSDYDFVGIYQERVAAYNKRRADDLRRNNQ